MKSYSFPRPSGRPCGSGSATRRVWFHADDLGATPAITTRLFDAWEQGFVDGFSVFGNCDHPGLVSERLAANPDRPARIATHLNLWEGRPVLPPDQVPRLVDRRGFFGLSFVGVLSRTRAALPVGHRSRFLDEVQREWRAQIDAVRDMIAPRRLTALDSHLHMHMIPELFRLTVELARQLDIPSIRLVREPFYRSRSRREVRSSRFLVNNVKRELLWRFAALDQPVAAGACLDVPDAMLGVLYSGMMSRANIGRGIACARMNGARSIEVLVHIGRADVSELDRWGGDRGKAAFAMSPFRDREYEELCRWRGRARLDRRAS